MPTMNLASAYITIMPDTSKLADGIKKSLSGLDADGKEAGKKLGDGMSKALKGKGKDAGGDLGKEITNAMERSLNGGATNVGKAGKKAADTFGKALDSELGNEVESAGKKASARLSDAFSGLKFGAIAGAAAGLTTSLLGSFGDMARGAAEASDATDKFKTTLQFAGLDTSTIDDMTAKVQKYADETVYDLGDIQNMTAQLAANGVNDYQKLAEAAGNLNAVSGGNADTFKSVGMVMTQTAGAGKLTTENWNQLADAIPGASGKIQEALLDAGAYTGNFRDAMADGQITAEEFNDAVMKLGSEPVAEEAAKSTATFEGMLGNLQATIEGELAKAFNELKPIIGAVIDGISNAAGTVLPVFVGAVKAAADGLKFLGEHKGPVLGVVGALGSLTAGIVAYNAAMKIQAAGGIVAMLTKYAKASKVAAAAQSIFNAALWTSPITWVVAGIAAVVAGLTLFFTKTETGRELWARFTELLGQGWDWVVAKFQSGWESIKAVAGFMKDAFTGLMDFWKTGDTTDLAQTLGLSEDSKLFTIAEGMRGALSSLKDFALEAWDVMRAKWEEFTTGFGQFYDTWIAPVQEAFGTLLDDLRGRFSSFGDGLAGVWESTVKPVFEFMKSAVQAVVDFMAPIFQTVLVGAFNVFATAVQSVWENMIKPAWGLMRDTFGIIADILTGNFENLGNRFSSMGDHIMGVVTGPLQVAWDVLKAGVTAAIEVAKSVINQFKDAVGRMVSAVKGKIDEMVAGFRAMPGKIKAAFASAGTWLLEAGKNIIRGLAQGVRNAAGMVENAVRAVIPDNIERFVPGLYLGGVVPAFARGGVLPNVPGVSRSERDPILGWSTERKQPIARVEPGEFIVNRDATRKNLPLLAAINGGKLNGKLGDLGLPGFADGGLVGFGDVLKFLRGGTVAGNSTPRSLEGAPYVWGGGLDGNWGDCSGTQSAVAALVAGVDTTGRKFATGTQGGWLSQHGFKRGRGPGKNAFETAYFNGGPWGGHTAGTLFDEKGKSINIEMGGGRGNGQIGGPAAGSRHSQFSDVWWHPLKGGGSLMEDGKIVGTSTEGVTVSNGIQLKTIDWGTASNLASEWEKRNHKEKALRRWSSGVFDTGGILKPGNFAFNASGRPERVLDPDLTRSFDKIAVHAPALADGMQRIAGVDWKGLVFEVESAWKGEDAGYVELANLMGDRIGLRVADKIAFAGAMTRDIQDGSNIRAYLENMSMSEGLDLGDQIGSMLGLDGLKATLGGVVTSFEKMEDAAVAQVDAAEAVKQAEENLAKARAEYREMQGSDVELSVKMQRRISDAEKNLAEARKSGKPDRIAKAEEKLKRTREDAAAELEKNGAKSAEELLKAQEQVTAAEDDLAKAHGAVQMAAQATGQTQIAMMLEVAKLAISIGKKIFEFAEMINQKIAAYESARAQMLGQYAGEIAKLNGLVAEQKAHVVDLADKWVDAVARVDEAIRKTAKAGAGILEAHVKGAKAIAEIQAQMNATSSSSGSSGYTNLYDMGLLWDSHADKLTATPRVKSQGGEKVTLANIAALQKELLAAQIDEQVMVKQAEAALLEAQFEQWKAQVALVRITQDQNTAWARLLQLQEMQVQFGMSEQQARIAEAINKLHMENAKANAELRNWGNNIGNFFDFDRDGKVFGLFTNVGSMSMQAAQMQIDANNKQIAAYEQLMAKYGGPVGTTPGQDKALDMMARLIANGKENVAQMAYIGSEFGNATRALNMAELNATLNKIDDSQLALTRQFEDLTAKMNFQNQMRPLQDEITKLEHERDSLKYLADAHKSETESLREANLALADYHANEAKRAQMKQSVDITIPGSGEMVDSDSIFTALNTLNSGLSNVEFKVNRLERAGRPGANAVLVNRR